MAEFQSAINFRVMTCGGCGVVWAMSVDFYDKRRSDRKTWYCPNGCQRHFTGPSEADRLRDELEREKQRREADQARALKLQKERDAIGRAHNRMRTRVMNGVCPCCNRTFQNLMRHMQTEHQGELNLRTLRIAFGLTQSGLAAEIGIYPAQVSLMEHGKRVPTWVQEAADRWVATQNPRMEESSS